MKHSDEQEHRSLAVIHPLQTAENQPQNSKHEI